MLSRYRMLGLLCLDNQKMPICLGTAEHALRKCTDEELIIRRGCSVPLAKGDDPTGSVPH
jgi:hypothetical protein